MSSCGRLLETRATDDGREMPDGETEAMVDRLTGRLVAAGRNLAGIGQDELAKAAGVSIEKVRLTEAAGSAWLSEEASLAFMRALESFGAIFIPDSDEMGAGVRLKFTRDDVKQIGRLESEGGPPLPDDVP